MEAEADYGQPYQVVADASKDEATRPALVDGDIGGDDGSSPKFVVNASVREY